MVSIREVLCVSRFLRNVCYTIAVAISWSVSLGAAYSSTLPTVNAVPVYDAPTAQAVSVSAAPAPQPAPVAYTPPPPQTHTPPSPIIDNSNTDFFVLLGRQPTVIARCPKCKITNARTRVKTYPSVTSWAMTAGMLFVCLSYRYMPLYFVPIAFLPLWYDKVRICLLSFGCVMFTWVQLFNSLIRMHFHVFNVKTLGCMMQLKKSDHYCGSCGRCVGSVAPLSDCGVMHYS